MEILSCRGIFKSFADIDVLEGVDLDIRRGERVGLVGQNGAGKSTLVKILTGELEADRGEVVKYKSHFKVGYLAQATDYSLEKFHDLFLDEENVSQMNDFYVVSGNLGLEKVQQWDDGRFGGLSGGEKTKMALARVWAGRPDLLILDEPTNHMDLFGIEWLIEELENYHGAVLIISHDRYFLDKAVNRIIELEDGKAKSYDGNYSSYREEKDREYQRQLQEYEVFKKKQARIENEIKQRKEWAIKGHNEARAKGRNHGMKFGGKEYYRKKAKKMDNQAKSKIKRLEKMKEEGPDKPKDEPEINFLFNEASKHGARILEGRDIEKGYDQRLLFQNASFYVQRGDIIGLFGPNGCGKSTLLNIILEEDMLDRGEIWVSPTASIGYLSQELDDMDTEQNVMEVLGLVRHTYTGDARNLLLNMGFDDAQLEIPVNQLSLGEQTKVKLADLILKGNDLLILDEPTNHLDIYSREQLEEALATFNGTIIIASHDQYMLEKLCTRMFVFEDKDIQMVEGGFKHYQRKKEQGEEELSQAKLKEEMMVIENKITLLLSRLNTFSSEEPEYHKLDQKFKKMLEKKRELSSCLQ